MEWRSTASTGLEANIHALLQGIAVIGQQTEIVGFQPLLGGRPAMLDYSDVIGRDSASGLNRSRGIGAPIMRL